MSHEKYEEYQECIAACHACAVACNHCAACCLQEPDAKSMARCIALDSDCAQICELAVAGSRMRAAGREGRESFAKAAKEQPCMWGVGAP